MLHGDASVAFSLNGIRLASVMNSPPPTERDRASYAARLAVMASLMNLPPPTDRPAGQLVIRPGQAGQTPGPSQSPDGKIGVKVNGLTAQLYDVTSNRNTGKPLAHRGASYSQIATWAFSDDGKMVAIAVNTPARKEEGHSRLWSVDVWDVETQERVLVPKNMNQRLYYMSNVSALTFTPDGKTLLVHY